MDLLDSTTAAGSKELRFTIPEGQAKALGEDAGTLAHEVAWLMWTVHALRVGTETTAEQWYDAVDNMYSLQRHLEGAMAAVMRNRVGADDGLSLAELGRATRVARSTAQTRRESVLSRLADADELWATGEAGR